MRRDFENYFTAAERGLRLTSSAVNYPEAWIDYQLPKDWRSDARYFLISNVVHMVVAPVQTVEGLAGVLRTEFRGALEADLHQIVRRAEIVAKERGRSYVSATSVSIALGQVAEKLETSSLQIWGPETERAKR